MTIFLRCPLSTKSASSAGSEVKLIARVSSSHSTSLLPRDMALPITTRSGFKFFQPDRIVPLVKGNAGISQHRAHRRVHAGIGPKHLVSGSAHQQRSITHRRTANTHEINLHLFPTISQPFPQRRNRPNTISRVVPYKPNLQAEWYNEDGISDKRFWPIYTQLERIQKRCQGKTPQHASDEIPITFYRVRMSYCLTPVVALLALFSRPHPLSATAQIFQSIPLPKNAAKIVPTTVNTE